MTYAANDDLPVMRGPSERGPSDGFSWNDQDDLARLAKVDDFLVETRQFGTAMRKIVRAYRRWKPGNDGRLIIVHGPSGSGKTTVADAVLEEVERMEGGTIDVGEAPGPEDADDEIGDAEADADDGDGTATIGRLPRTAGLLKEGPNGYLRPIVKVFVEPRTRSTRLLRGIVRSLGARPALGATYAELVDMLNTQLDGQHTRMIILDEVHHMVDGQGADVIKMLLVQARIQVVGIGLPHASSLATETPNDDLERHVHALCPMGALGGDGTDGEWRGFLSSLSQEMPFDLKPEFAEAGMSVRLHVATEGLVGKLMSLVQVATETAIDDDLATIDLVALDKAFRQTHDVGRLATPFDMKDFSPEAYKPVREKIRKRTSLKRSVEKANQRLLPDFRKE